MGTPAKSDNNAIAERVKVERQGLITHLNDWLETPLLILGFVWLGMLVYEIVWNRSPLLEFFVAVIWVIFIFDFVFKFWLAPDKTDYLRSNWLTALALIVPALRVF